LSEPSTIGGDLSGGQAREAGKGVSPIVKGEHDDVSSSDQTMTVERSRTAITRRRGPAQLSRASSPSFVGGVEMHA
jgi:hypothetical protein